MPSNAGTNGSNAGQPTVSSSITKDRFLRGVAIYGANASGKSNLIRALHELQELVRRSHTFELGSAMPFSPFQLDKESSNRPTLFSIRFVAQGVRYHFQLAYVRMSWKPACIRC